MSLEPTLLFRSNPQRSQRDSEMNKRPGGEAYPLRESHLLKVPPTGYVEDETIVNEAAAKGLFIVPRTSSPIIPKKAIAKAEMTKRNLFEKRNVVVKRKSSTTELVITEGKTFPTNAAQNFGAEPTKQLIGAKNINSTECGEPVRAFPGTNAEVESSNKTSAIDAATTNVKVENANKISNVTKKVSRLRHMLGWTGGQKSGKENSVPVVIHGAAMTNMIYAAERQPDRAAHPGEVKLHVRCRSDPAESKVALPGVGKQTKQIIGEATKESGNIKATIATKQNVINTKAAAKVADSPDGNVNCVGKAQAPGARLAAPWNRKSKPIQSTVVARGVRVHVLPRTRQSSASSVDHTDHHGPIKGVDNDIEYIPMFSLHTNDQQSLRPNQWGAALVKQPETDHYQRLQAHTRTSSSCSRHEANANVARWLTETSIAPPCNEHLHGGVHKQHYPEVSAQFFPRTITGGRGVSCRAPNRAPPENYVARKSRRFNSSCCESSESEARVRNTRGSRNVRHRDASHQFDENRRRSYHLAPPVPRPTPVGTTPLRTTFDNRHQSQQDDLDNKHPLQDLDKFCQTKLNASLLQFVTEVLESLEAARATNDSSEWSSHAFGRSFSTPLAEGDGHQRETPGSRSTGVHKIPKILLNNCPAGVHDDFEGHEDGGSGGGGGLAASPRLGDRRATGEDDANKTEGDRLSKLDSGVSGSVDSVRTALDNLHTNLVEVFERAENNMVGLGEARRGSLNASSSQYPSTNENPATSTRTVKRPLRSSSVDSGELLQASAKLFPPGGTGPTTSSPYLSVQLLKKRLLQSVEASCHSLGRRVETPPPQAVRGGVQTPLLPQGRVGEEGRRDRSGALPFSVRSHDDRLTIEMRGTNAMIYDTDLQPDPTSILQEVDEMQEGSQCLQLDTFQVLQSIIVAQWIERQRLTTQLNDERRLRKEAENTCAQLNIQLSTGAQRNEQE